MFYINKFSNYLYAFFVSVIFILLLFFQNIKYIYDNNCIIENIFLLASGLILLGIFKLCCFTKLSKINFNFLVYIFTIILLFYQIVMAYNILFWTGWDCGPCLKSSIDISNGKLGLYYCYTTYPQNIVITFINAIILFVNNKLGLFSGNYIQMPIVIINAIFSSCACLLIYYISKIFVNEKIAFIAFLLGIFTFGISPYVTICYSDAFAILTPILILFLYIKFWKKGKVINLAHIIIPILGFLYYLIKPQSILIFIAIYVYELIIYLCDVKNLKLLIKLVLVLFIFCSLYISYSKVITKVFPPDYALGPSHYLMMGLNKENNGIYYQKDVDFSQSFKTQAERKVNNYKVIKERLISYGFIGLMEHYSKKILVTYNDGTFAWGCEGKNFYEKLNDTSNKFSLALRSIYYNHGLGKNFKYYVIFAQFIWINILGLLVLNIFYKSKDEEKEKYVAILRMTFVFLVLFMLLFECRARYIYTNIPLYCIMASMGLSVLNDKFNFIRDKIKEGKK